MDILFSISVTFFVLILSIYKGIFVGYPLILGFLIFAFIAFRRGFKIKEIIRMSVNGGKKSFVVLRILLLIGAITGIWMASGTVPAIIYYGIKYMNPNYFILYSFLISCIVSLLLGSSLATVSTVGIALVLMAKNTNININIIAGAIISGAYFGDRCSPMSSSANLVANITNTDLYTNIKNMLKTALIPFILSIIIYFIISIEKTVNFIQTNLSAQILQNYNINIIVLLPAIIILIFSILKIDVKISMLISIILASSIALMLQKYTLYEVLKFLVIGYHLPSSNPLYHILRGGGIISMWKASVVIFISCSLSGIFNETNMLKTIEEILKRAKTRYVLFLYTAIVSVSTAAFGCNQSISIILTNNLMNKNYTKCKLDNHQLAVDIENTAVVLSALIPWNIAAFVPTTTLGVGSIGFIPYAFYLYLLPIIYFLYLYISYTRYKKLTANNYEYKH